MSAPEKPGLIQYLIKMRLKQRGIFRSGKAKSGAASQIYDL